MYCAGKSRGWEDELIFEKFDQEGNDKKRDYLEENAGLREHVFVLALASVTLLS